MINTECLKLAEFSTAVRESTLKRLRLVPSGFANWRLSSEVMSFADIAQHLIDVDEWVLKKLKVKGIKPIVGKPFLKVVSDHAQYLSLLDELERSGQSRCAMIEEISDTKLSEIIFDERFGKKVSVWWIIVRGNLDHEIHHRGQIAVYLRMIRNHKLNNERPAEVSNKSKSGADYNPAIIFAAYAESEEELLHVRFLAESIRAFAGRFSDAPVWVYMPESLAATAKGVISQLRVIGAEIKTSSIPDQAQWFYYAGKVIAAGKAEVAAEGKATVLVWMDEDTIVLREPAGFILNNRIGFAYRPVMHNRSGSLYAEPPDLFWSRIYEKLSVDTSLLFPMVTPADRQTIRAYFNAGLLVVRPEHGILRKWGESFRILYCDSVLVDMCRQDTNKRIFLHQTALVGAVLNTLDRDAIFELPDRYNYPIFFKKMFDADSEFDSIEDIVTLRYDVYFRKPDPNWSDQLKGSAHLISWMKERLGK